MRNTLLSAAAVTALALAGGPAAAQDTGTLIGQCSIPDFEFLVELNGQNFCCNTAAGAAQCVPEGTAPPPGGFQQFLTGAGGGLSTGTLITGLVIVGIIVAATAGATSDTN